MAVTGRKADTVGVKIAVGVVAVAVVLAGCSSGGTTDAAKPASNTPTTASASAAPFLLTGSLSLGKQTWLSATGAAGETCTGNSDRPDLKVGAQVAVTDGAGKTIGLGSVTEATVLDPDTCKMRFSVQDVPRGEGFYSIQIGQQPATKLSESDATKDVSLTLG